MNHFEYANPKSLDDAVALLSDSWGETEVLAGGTDLLTSMKQGLTSPKRLVSLKDVKGMDKIETSSSKLVIGAATTLKSLIENADVQKHFPGLITAATNIGSDQITNMGTVGGDLLQRPRCWYYRNGFGLFGTEDGKALIPDGDNRYHAIFGNAGSAKFVHASSFAPLLIALGASVTLKDSKGERTANAADFFATPKSESDRESVIKPNEILTAITIPLSGKKNGVYEIRPRRGLDWPMVTAAVAYDEKGGKAQNAVVVLGHVAPVPWVATKAGSALNGNSPGDAAKAAGAAASEGATPLSRNSYKVTQVNVSVRRAIEAAQA